ncbi:hypothetical protein T4D_10046 [Trichinella pseudospiralis]|uniref:Uncharacterized protein n=1 Tax=Trichinella pseudospiralis TaxID=6337 RepID=A0A0V1F9G6_TRIPS|nr:hypothetical protein T4D_10046 [Trichinella pseudospiralis]
MALPSIPMLMPTKPMIQPIFGRLTLLTQFSMFPAEQTNFSAQIAGYVKQKKKKKKKEKSTPRSIVVSSLAARTNKNTHYRPAVISGKKVGQVLTGQVLNGAVSTRPY